MHNRLLGGFQMERRKRRTEATSFTEEQRKMWTQRMSNLFYTGRASDVAKLRSTTYSVFFSSFKQPIEP